MRTATRLKWYLSEVDVRAGRRSDELPLMSVSIDWGVRRRDEITSDLARTEDLSRYKVCRRGDIVLNRMRAFQGALGVAPDDGIVSPDYAVLRASHSVDPSWLALVMKTPQFLAEIVARLRGIGGTDSGNVRTPRINVNDLLDVEWSVPTLDEQVRVMDFLDAETTQIDTLIGEQQRFVELLKERRAGLIASETLRGTDPLHIPSRTEVPFAALGYGYEVTLGKMLDAGRALREGDVVLPYVRAANLQDKGLTLDDVNSMPYSSHEARALNLRAGDVLVVEGGAVGTSVVLPEEMPGWSFQKTVNRLRGRKGWDPRFHSYVLRTYRDIGVIDVVCNKSTIPHLTAEKLRSLRVPAPDAGEQRRIADYLDEHTASIDTLIAEAEHNIALSKERRAALITAAVTGQSNVATVEVA